MLPKKHIILGAIFSALVWFILPDTAWYNILLIFLSSFLIDFDHYICAVIDGNSYSLPKALKYYEKVGEIEKRECNKGIKRRGNFHIFHTVEFHALVFAIGLTFEPFLYIFAGMLFHSILDIISMSYLGRIYRREYFLTNWIKKDLRIN